MSATVDTLHLTNPALLEMKGKIAELQAALLAKHPQLPNMLRKIHAQVRQDPELATLLDEEEIGVIVNGLKVQTQTEIVTSKEKAATSANKQVKNAIKAAGSSAVDLF